VLIAAIALGAIAWPRPAASPASTVPTIATVTPALPVPTRAPVKAVGLRVVLIHDGLTITPSRAAVFNDLAVRRYLQSHCAIGPDGKSREWWIADCRHPSLSASDTPATLRDAMARPRAFEPWLVIRGGRLDFEGPMPPTAAETIALLKRLGV
jgi:hypothetical protein